jgi:hypothetical protein
MGHQRLGTPKPLQTPHPSLSPKKDHEMRNLVEDPSFSVCSPYTANHCWLYHCTPIDVIGSDPICWLAFSDYSCLYPHFGGWDPQWALAGLPNIRNIDKQSNSLVRSHEPKLVKLQKKTPAKYVEQSMWNLWDPQIMKNSQHVYRKIQKWAT